VPLLRCVYASRNEVSPALCSQVAILACFAWQPWTRKERWSALACTHPDAMGLYLETMITQRSKPIVCCQALAWLSSDVSTSTVRVMRVLEPPGCSPALGRALALGDSDVDSSRGAAW